MNFNPFVRCVGIGSNIYQSNENKAYDHRLICFLKGEGYIYIDNEKFETEACQIYFIRPGIAYRVCCSENQEIAVINFDTSYEYASFADTIPSVDAALFDSSKIMSTGDIPLVQSKMSVNNDDLLLLYRMYDTYLRNDLASETKNFCLSAQLSYLISRAVVCHCDSKPTAISSVIYKYIIDNAHKKITVCDVAEYFNYSTSFVEKSLRKNYGSSYKQLIIETRLKKALWLLENTDLSCTEIASRLGFSSSQHFSTSFIKKYGKRPSDYK